MKRLLALLAVFGMLMYGASNNVIAQDDVDETTTEMTDDTSAVDEADSTMVEEQDSTLTEQPAESEEIEEAEEAVPQKTGGHQQLKQKFIEGGAGFMGIVLLSLIFGLALAIERIIYLNLAKTNKEKLLNGVEEALNSGGVEAAKEVCRNTKGPIASIFYQGLDRSDEGIDVVEKSVIAYGSVQMGLLEKGLSWISLFISLAPMLGFMGTVIGMIGAFDAIKAAGDISPSLVAGGISVALITTVSGLVVAMILQVFYNYIVAEIDSIVNNMEDASISLIDILTKYNMKK